MATAARKSLLPLSAVRLYAAFKARSAAASRLRTFCGVPVLFYLVVALIAFFVSLVLLIQLTLSEDENRAGVLIALSVFGATFVACASAPAYLVLVRVLVNTPQRRLKRLARRLPQLPFERLVQKLQAEVDLLTTLVHALDAFTNSQTRLVVTIDGLDSCEQSSIVQLLDALSLFFGARQNAPYVVILAADAHILESALQTNLHGASSAKYEITGHDYLNNIVSMPFHLHHQALRQLQERVRAKAAAADDDYVGLERRRSATLRGSRLSLRGDKEAGGNLTAPSAQSVNTKENLVNSLMVNDFSQLFPSNDYFVNMNPRLLRRIINSIALSGRLLRTFEVEFSWFLLYFWISLLEQWPFRMTFLVDFALDEADDAMSIFDLFRRTKAYMPTAQSLAALDRNPKEFKLIMRRMAASKGEHLTVGHLKAFYPCTSNLDPYLKKRIRELVIEAHGKMEHDDERDVTAFTQLEKHALSNAQYLFDDAAVWTRIERALPLMSVDDVCALVRRLKIDATRAAALTQTLRAANLNGLALQSCDLGDLRAIVDLPLGDWSLFKLLVEALRVWRPRPRGAAAAAAAADAPLAARPPRAPRHSLSEGRDNANLLSINEEDADVDAESSSRSRERESAASTPTDDFDRAVAVPHDSDDDDDADGEGGGPIRVSSQQELLTESKDSAAHSKR